MKRRILVHGWLLITCLAAAASSSPAVDDPAREALRRRIEAPHASRALGVEDQPVFCSESMTRFYDQRGYRPAWSDTLGILAGADTLVVAIREAVHEGLNPLDYHLGLLADLIERGKADGPRAMTTAARVDLDLLLTDAFLLLGTHFLSGHLDPASIDPEWVAYRRAGDMPATLASALADDSVGRTLRRLLPAQPGYARLRSHLRQLREIRDRGGWPTIPEGPAIKPGGHDPRLALVAARLGVQDLHEPVSYDDQLIVVVKEFQSRHGLAADGVIGPATLGALNTPVDRRIAQVLVNMERWRWLPEDLGPRHILVNIADQTLAVVVDGREVLHSAVIVGRQYRRTPVFSGRITHLVFRPFWEVPPSIARDKLPEFRADPRRLVELGFQVLSGWGESEREVDPLAVDWSAVPAKSFPYRLRQKPGPRNALGSVKFMFPNEYSVYLHDTSSPELFSSNVRTFSSGCIRVQKPRELAQILLAGDDLWTEETVSRAMAGHEPRTVRIASRWMVHLLYWTCWITTEGAAEYRDDIYGRDDRVLAALRTPAPTFP